MLRRLSIKTMLKSLLWDADTVTRKTDFPIADNIVVAGNVAQIGHAHQSIKSGRKAVLGLNIHWNRQ